MCQYQHKDNNEQSDKDVKTETDTSYWCKNCKRKFTTKGDLNINQKIHGEKEKSDNSMRTEYVSKLLIDSNCENVQIQKAVIDALCKKF